MLPSSDYFRMTILPILPRLWPRSRTPQHRADTRFLCSGFSFGQSWQLKNNCQYCQTSKVHWQSWQWSNGLPILPILPMVRPLDRPTVRPSDHPPRHQAWIVMPIRSVIVLFARSLFVVGFLLAKPPPRADGLAGQGRWVHKKFFYFYPPNSLLS